MTRLIRRPIEGALFLSLLIHAIFALVLLITPQLRPEIQNQIEVQLVQNVPNLRSKKIEDVKQVVEQDEKRINEDTPDDTKFLSAHTQKIIKQMVAKNHGEFKNAKNAFKNPGESGSFKPVFDVSKSISDSIKKEQELEKTLDDNAVVIADGKRKPTQQNKQGVGGSDSSSTIDYIKDVDAGLETLLSTREFIYYTYYARIRRQLNQHWGSKVKEKVTKLYKEGRNIASTEDKVTKCLVTLDAKGNLAKVQVISNSGVRDLDDAAVEAFRAAGPFPNPPQGIVDPDGTIKIRWDFILEG